MILIQDKDITFDKMTKSDAISIIAIKLYNDSNLNDEEIEAINYTLNAIACSNPYTELVDNNTGFKIVTKINNKHSHATVIAEIGKEYDNTTLYLWITMRVKSKDYNNNATVNIPLTINELRQAGVLNEE